MIFDESSNLASRRALLQQQARLFRHLSGILCQLCERIDWCDLESVERRRMRRLAAGLSSEIHAVQLALGSNRRTSSRHASSCRRNPGTTKAAFRKR
ncbi:MAG: hypothetical protein JWN98_2449 [Abditibacteriota bacterium]|nr:hypothetical protein [Abditibacteriota bacterium]